MSPSSSPSPGSSNAAWAAEGEADIRTVVDTARLGPGPQPALADREPEQLGKRALQPLVGQRLEGLEVGCGRMQARPERRALDRRRRDRPPAPRAAHGQA